MFAHQPATQLLLVKMEIRDLFLFPTYKIIVFNGDRQWSYGISGSKVCMGTDSNPIRYMNNDFVNSGISVENCKMLGCIRSLTDNQVKQVFTQAGYKEELYPDFTNPDGEKLVSPLESLKSFLVADNWPHDLPDSWIIIPKPDKNLSGKTAKTEFELPNADFSEINTTQTLTVYYNAITARTTEVKFSVEIPDYLYEFLMQHPELEKRPVSKVITNTSFASLKSEMHRLGKTAVELTELDRQLQRTEKIILINFASDQAAKKDNYQFGYVGKTTNIVFNYFIGHRTSSDYRYVYVEKKFEHGKGFVDVKGRMAAVSGHGHHKVIPWTQEREDFLAAIENNFKQLSDNLNNYLKDLTPEKLDLLAAGNVKLLPESK